MNISASRQLFPKSVQKVVLLLGILFAWHQSHFQFDLYLMSKDVASAIYLVMLTATITGLAAGAIQKVPRALFLLILKYVLLCSLFGLLTFFQPTKSVEPMFFIKAIIFAGFMLWVVSDQVLIRTVLRINIWLGFVLFLLNSVTIAHWLGWLHLPYEVVERVGGKYWEGHLDPFSFGIFGLTENHVDEFAILGLARLQGFGPEPLHWAYFVMFSAASAFALLALSSRSLERIFLKMAITFMAVYAVFLQSSTMVLSIAGIGLVMLLFTLLRLRSVGDAKKTTLLFGGIVFFPGIILPFLLVQVPNIQALFLADTLLNEGSNWAGKIDFMALGSNLYTILLPYSWNNVSASHNLILEKYIDGGYLFVIILLYFFYDYLRQTVNIRSFSFTCAVAISIIGNTITAPSQFFYPSGALWLFSIAGAVQLFRCRNFRDPNEMMKSPPRVEMDFIAL